MRSKYYENKYALSYDFFGLFDKIVTVLLTVGAMYSTFVFLFPDLCNTMSCMKVYGFFSLLLIIKTCISPNLTKLGPAHILFLYTIISSFGYDIMVFFDGERAYSKIAFMRHSYIEYFNQANSIYFLGLIFMLVGFSIGAKKEIINQNVSDSDPITSSEKYWYLKISFWIVTVYSGLLVIAVLTGMMPLTNYSEVRDWFSTQPLMSYLLRLTWVAMPTYFYFMEDINKLVKISIPLVVMFTILMITGYRNEILYPVSISVGVFMWKRANYHNKRRIPILVIVISIIIVFVLNPLISSTRNNGISLEILLSGSFGFSDALFEMGQQLNPLSIILYALDNNITNYKYGITLLVPTISILSLNTIFGTSVYNTSMEYNPTLVLNHLGHYGRGFSSMAELYYNFGIMGMIVCMYLMGVYIAKSELKINKSRHLLFYFQIMPLLMIWSRNIFGLNILIIIFAIILNFIVGFLARKY